MTISTHVNLLEIDAPLGADPVRVRLRATRISDAPDVAALGLEPKATMFPAECSRADFDAFIAKCKITSVEDWPEALIALPAPRKTSR